MNTTTEQTRAVTEAEMDIIRWAVTGLAVDVAGGACPEHLDAAEVEQLTQLLAHLDNHGSVFHPRLQCALVIQHQPRCYLLGDD
jgi:histidinol dehydrogenase